MDDWSFFLSPKRLLADVDLEPAEKNQNEHDDGDRSQDAGRAITPAEAVRPSREGADEQQDENDEEDGSERHVISFLTSMLRSYIFKLASGPIRGAEIDSGKSDQSAAARVIDRLDARDASREVGMAMRDMGDQLRLGICWTCHQNCPRVCDRPRDLFQEALIRRRVATARQTRLATNAPGRIMRTDDRTIGLGCAEMQDFRFSVIDPNDCAKVDVHDSGRKHRRSSRITPGPASRRIIDHRIMILTQSRRQLRKLLEATGRGLLGRDASTKFIWPSLRIRAGLDMR